MLHAFVDPTLTPRSLPSNDPSDPPSLEETLQEDSHSARNRAQVVALHAALAQHHILNAQIELARHIEAAQRSALADASAAARLAHKDHERRALDLQMNDRSGFYA